jgi:hypothetical protein
MKSFAFAVTGCVAWYCAWRAEAKRRSLFEQAQRLMKIREEKEAFPLASTAGLGNNYDFHLKNGSPVLYHRERR